MFAQKLSIFLLTALISSISFTVYAETTLANAFVFKPPLRGQPVSRVGGGSRGDDNPVIVELLIPEGAGLSSKADPDLIWYYNGPKNGKLTITIMDPQSYETLIEAPLPSPVANGLQTTSLKSLNISLKSNIEYEWIINSSSMNQSGETLQSWEVGAILYQPLSSDLQALERQPLSLEQARNFALNGYWLDGIGLLNQIRFSPTHSESEVAQAAISQLASQVGLKQFSNYFN